MRPDLEAIRERCESLLDSYDCYPHSMPHVAIELVDDDIPALLAYVEKLERVAEAAKSAIRCDLWGTHEYSYECQGKNQSVCAALAALEADDE